MPEAPPPANEQTRIAALHSLNILDTPREERFDRITRIASRLFNVPIALVSLVDVNRQWFKSRVGLPDEETPRSQSFCAYAIHSTAPFVIEDAAADPRFADNPLVTGEPYIRFYAGQPLTGPGGHLVGTLCLIDREPRTITTEDLALLRDLSSWASDELNSVGLSQALTARTESEQRVRAVMESVADGIATFDESGIIESFNPAAERLFGRSADEVRGEPVGILLDEPYREPMARRLQQISAASEVITDARRDLVGQRKDGTTFPMSLAVSTVSIGDRRLFVGAARDMTETRRARHQLEALQRRMTSILSSLGEGVCAVDRDGVISYANPASAAMTGYTPAEMVGRQLHALLHHTRPDGSPYPASECPIYRALIDGVSHRVPVDLFWRKDGTSFPVESICTPNIEDGQIVGGIVSFDDITSRLAVEKMKDEFVSVVSHELRTPLTSIRGSLGLVAGGVFGSLPDEAKEMIDIAVTNTERLVRLINDILDIERIESGHIAMERRPSNLADLMTGAVDTVVGMADRAGVRLDVEPLSLEIDVDPDRIVQVVTNLLSNAVKFSDEGDTVRLHAERMDNVVLISVRDEGRGVPPDKLQAIFGRFQQVDASDARQKGGTGLGLAISRSIVELHGGQIWVDSVVDEGSTFFVSLPITPSAHLPLEDTEPSPGPRILLCDDDEDVRTTVAELLHEYGYDAVTATSGPEAIEVAKRRRPRAILLDVIMPDIDGWETLRRLKRDPVTCDIPVVLFTSSLGVEGKSGLHGAADWIMKPTTENHLVQTLERVIEEANSHCVLIVEDDADLARVLQAMFDRDGIDTEHASTEGEAIEICNRSTPDLLVLDMGLPDGDGFGVVDWLRQNDRLKNVPVIVYTARDLSDADRARLQLGETHFINKGRSAPAEFQRHVVDVLRRIAPYPEKDRE